MSTNRVMILDTDIGTDVDDMLALIILAKAKEANLVGVTTVYGDTRLRAKIAKHVCNLLGRPDIPVIAGEEATLTNRTVWWPGHEGKGIHHLDKVEIEEETDAVTFLQVVAHQYPRELELVAIGPLTNLAKAISSDRAFASSVRHLYIMGGAFWLEKAEHNIKSDPEAAKIVFESGVPITVCGLDVTTCVWLRDEELRMIVKDNPLGCILEDQVRRWWAFKGQTQNHPHDPIAVLTALNPELFEFEHCDVRIGVSDQDLGESRPTHCGQGEVRIASRVDVEAITKELVTRLALPSATLDSLPNE